VVHALYVAKQKKIHTMPKLRIVFIVTVYQIVPLILVGAWVMPAFFDLFGVDQNDMSWRSYIVCAGGWIIMEVPLFVWLIFYTRNFNSR
jgi:hypothetical protein